MALHLVRISIEAAARRAPIVLDLGVPGALQKWTILPAAPASTETLVAIASSLAPGRIAEMVAPHLRARFTHDGVSLRTEYSFVREERDGGRRGPCEGASQLSENGWEPLRSASGRTGKCPDTRLDARLRKATPLGNLVLAYGKAPAASTADSYDFSDTAYPFRRIGTLLDPRARLTSPIRFLERINAKAHECGTTRQKQFLARLCGALAEALARAENGAGARGCPPELSFAHWTERSFPYQRAWRCSKLWERSLLSVVVDAARHANDAFPQCACPFDQSGIVLLDRPDHYCPLGRQVGFFEALDHLFPRFQFVLTLGRRARSRFPRALADKRLAMLPDQPARSPPYKSVRIRPRSMAIRRGSALLVQVDGTLPNFALMQLSRELKSKGHRVGLSLGFRRVEEPAAVYASCVFTSAASMRCLERLRQHYGDRVIVGGSGVDLERRLGPAIEALPPDYSLYPSLGDRAMGFLTRGCPGRCAFCAVPRKEGRVRQVADLDMLLQGRRKKLILLDDNILAYPKATELLEEMVRRDVQVNFNQTLDLRRLEAEQAGLLRRLRCSNLAFHRRVYHLSLNDCRGLDRLRRHYDLLRVSSEDNAEFVCMYGYNTSLAEDLERLRFLRSLPRAYVFMQRYRPLPGGPPPVLSRLFDERTDEHLDALVRVVFPQNMKNVERYYQWLCLEYARQCGRIHIGLVDTLFRYNHRHMRGAFLQRLREVARSAGASNGVARRMRCSHEVVGATSLG